jgi:LPS O-antigen subunit length determinant protein (WzzB/FepE family)
LFKSSSNEDAQKKIDNTIEFAKSIVEGGKLYTNGDNTPIETRTFYIGNQPPPFNHGDEL